MVSSTPEHISFEDVRGGRYAAPRPAGLYFASMHTTLADFAVVTKMPHVMATCVFSFRQYKVWKLSACSQPACQGLPVWCLFLQPKALSSVQHSGAGRGTKHLFSPPLHGEVSEEDPLNNAAKPAARRAWSDCGVLWPEA